MPRSERTDGTVECFNPTWVRLKQEALDAINADVSLQSHMGSSET